GVEAWRRNCSRSAITWQSHGGELCSRTSKAGASPLQRCGPRLVNELPRSWTHDPTILRANPPDGDSGVEPSSLTERGESASCDSQEFRRFGSGSVWAGLGLFEGNHSNDGLGRDGHVAASLGGGVRNGC